MTNQAIRPSFYTEFTSDIEKIEEKTPDENQQALAYITHYKGWQLLKEYKVRLEEYLDSSLSQAISNGATREEIGDRAVVKELAKFVLNSFIRKAEDARKFEE